MKVRFGNIELDVSSRQLWRDRREVHLSTKAFDLLTLLVERRPAVVAKADIQRHIWPDTFVSDSNLPTLIAEVREAIGDDGRRGRYVRTVHGLGYSFVADAVKDEQPQRAAFAWLIGPTNRVEIGAGDNVLGREGAGVVALDSPTISRRHARVVMAASGATVEDLGSKNGTWVNGVRVTTPMPVADGDVVRVGSLVFTFRIARPGTSTQTI